MKTLFLATLAVLLTLPACAFELSPGFPFPKLVLPSIQDREAINIEDHFGEKMMLHVFASW